MIQNEHSIYNAQSVYNQGGGGGSSFDVVVNGVTNTLVFPAFLTPVEYIDTSEYTGSGLCIQGSNQTPRNPNQHFKIVIRPNHEKMSTLYPAKPFGTAPAFNYSNNQEIYCYLQNWGSKSASLSYGYNTHQFDGVDFTKKFSIEYFSQSKIFKLKYDGGGSQTFTDSRNNGSGNFGQWSVINYFNAYNDNIFHGRFYYAYLLSNYDSKIDALWVPAKMKDGSSEQPYIVECVGGAVGINLSGDDSTTGIEFGPDIDLSEEIQSWIT